MIRVLEKVIICGILVCVIMNVIKHVQLANIQIIKNCSCEKRLIGKLALEYVKMKY